MKTDQQRVYFVEKWANYVINNSDWSELQAVLINSQIQSARQIKLTKEQVNYIKATQTKH